MWATRPPDSSSFGVAAQRGMVDFAAISAHMSSLGSKRSCLGTDRHIDSPGWRRLLGLYVHPFVLGFNGSYPTGEVVGQPGPGSSAVASPTTFCSPSSLARVTARSTNFFPSSSRLAVTTIFEDSTSSGQV